MEFNQLATVGRHENGAECNILNPITNEPTDFYVKVCGADSKVWRAAKKKQTNAIITARSNLKDGQTYEDIDIDFDALDIQALVDATLDWRGLANKGKEVKFTAEAAKDLYEQAPDVVKQLLYFIGNGENFMHD